jgi:hypothetical protein
MEDSTFKAFVRDRNFLRTILPISDELNYILQRIFDTDPKRRISLGELRDLIIRCPRFTQSQSAASLPPTPPQTPMEKPVDCLIQAMENAMEIPPMELPGQQYPTQAVPQIHAPQPIAVPTGLVTPPGSNACSPQLHPYTYATKPVVAAAGSPFAAQSGLFPTTPAWPRCGQLISNFHVPRSCFWPNVPVY